MRPFEDLWPITMEENRHVLMVIAIYIPTCLRWSYYADLPKQRLMADLDCSTGRCIVDITELIQ